MGGPTTEEFEPGTFATDHARGDDREDLAICRSLPEDRFGLGGLLQIVRLAVFVQGRVIVGVPACGFGMIGSFLLMFISLGFVRLQRRVRAREFD